MALIHLDAFPSLVPIPQLYGHVIGGCEDERLVWVNDNGANVIRMSFEGGDFLGGIVVIDSYLEIVGAADDPILASNKAPRTDRDICKLERLDNSLGLVRPYVNVAAV